MDIIYDELCKNGVDVDKVTLSFYINKLCDDYSDMYRDVLTRITFEDLYIVWRAMSPTGSYLGDLTDELDGGYITTFVLGGPKNYAYETNTEKTVCKVRGITLNYRTVEKVNFNLLCNMVKGVGPEKISVDIPFKIIRDTKEKSVKTRRECKNYRIVYTKRVIVNNFNTFPCGF